MSSLVPSLSSYLLAPGVGKMIDPENEVGKRPSPPTGTSIPTPVTCESPPPRGHPSPGWQIGLFKLYPDQTTAGTKTSKHAFNTRHFYQNLVQRCLIISSLVQFYEGLLLAFFSMMKNWLLLKNTPTSRLERNSPPPPVLPYMGQEPITRSFHMCCTLESTLSSEELFLEQDFPRKYIGMDKPYKGKR